MAPSLANSLLGTYLQFLRSPVLSEPPEDIAPSKACGQILYLYTIHFLLVALAGVIITQFSGAADESLITDAITDMSAWTLFFAAVVTAPILEDCFFRLPLRPFAFNLALPGSMVDRFFTLMIVRPGPLLLFITGMLIGLNLYVWIKRSKVMIFQPIYRRYGGAIFYFLTLVFGAIHITNYGTGVWALLPLLVMPQVIVSLWLGFVRIRYGFRWAVFAHAFHNGCLMIPLCLTKLFGSDQLQAYGLEKLDMETLTASDQLLVGGLGLYMLAGMVACVFFAWKLLKEWRKSQY